MKAWVTLLSNRAYLHGVVALKNSIVSTRSKYPLVVMVTPDLDSLSRRLLMSNGCIVHEVDPVLAPPDLSTSYASPQFSEVWTKLQAWSLQHYDQIVLLDADMVLIQNMDELLEIDLPKGHIAACHACLCNPHKRENYPEDWVPERCHYSFCDADACSYMQVARSGDYFNSGLVVLRPDPETFDLLSRRVDSLDAEDRFPFPDQDLLNEQFRGKWITLPYIYNALKTMSIFHKSIWEIGSVKNIHFIMDKPWQRDVEPYRNINSHWWAAYCQARDSQPQGGETYVHAGAKGDS